MRCGNDAVYLRLLMLVCIAEKYMIDLNNASSSDSDVIEVPCNE